MYGMPALNASALPTVWPPFSVARMTAPVQSVYYFNVVTHSCQSLESPSFGLNPNNACMRGNEGEGSTDHELTIAAPPTLAPQTPRGTGDGPDGRQKSIGTSSNVDTFTTESCYFDSLRAMFVGSELPHGKKV